MKYPKSPPFLLEGHFEYNEAAFSKVISSFSICFFSANASCSVGTTINDVVCQMLSKRGVNKKRELFPALQGLFS